MVDEKGLTEEQRKKALDWINKRVPGLQCPVCKTKSFGLQEYLTTPMIMTPDRGIQFGGVAYPQVMLICNHCTHTLLFNAVQMGILTESDEPENKRAVGDG